MRYVYTIFVFLTALLISTGCGLVQKAIDEIPAAESPAPAADEATENDDETTGEAESPILADDELEEEEEPAPRRPDPAIHRVYITDRITCRMSALTHEDDRIRIIGRYDVYVWSNGDRHVSVTLIMQRDYASVGAWAAERWYLNGQDTRNDSIDFATYGHSDEGIARGFRVWWEGDRLYAEEPGIWTVTSQPRACGQGSF